MHIHKNQSIISKSDESTQTDSLIGCPNTVENFALANDLIKWIIGTIISSFLLKFLIYFYVCAFLLKLSISYIINKAHAN